MVVKKQYLNKNWYALIEKQTETDSNAIKQYSTTFNTSNCISTDIPALVVNMFPRAENAIWYYNKFQPKITPDNKHRIYLCFERVVCLCEIWINGIFVGRHIHSEEPFSFDITDSLLPGDNIIACRVYGPVKDNRGPYGISMDTVPNYAQIFNQYTAIPKTGIYENVYIEKRPLIDVSDWYVKTNYDSGKIDFNISLQNKSLTDTEITITYTVSDYGSVILTDTLTTTLNAREESTIKTSVHLENHICWSPDNPKLYDVQAEIVSSYGVSHISKRIGFKDFRVKDGWFYLNGERIWLTCAHSIKTKEAIVHAKTMGFKALRFLTEMPSVELLDFCDEIGMMVYEECAVSWGMTDYPDMKKHMSEYLDNMIKRDRSHVCIAIWGIFNEQHGENAFVETSRYPTCKEVFKTAVNYLPKMRSLDNTKLILLSSGRLDARADIGSYSNPGSVQWEYGWGEEAADATTHAPTPQNKNLFPYITMMGDNHLYPTIPFQNDIRDFIRNIGRNSSPVFISEYGVGYPYALYDLYYDLITNEHSEHPERAFYEIQIKRLTEFIELYHLQNIYPTPNDFLMSAIKTGAQQRIESIDLLRANPRLCGYSLTSFSIGNEGVYFRKGGMIPGITEALRDSFAPLK